MGDMGEYWNDVSPELKKESKQNRSDNQAKSIELLEMNGIEYKQLSPTHFRVSDYDFWPSTGLFMNTKTNKRGRGVFNLIKLANVKVD